MLPKARNLLLVVLTLAAGFVVRSHADDRFLVRASSATIAGIALRHQLTILGAVDDQAQLYLLSNSTAETADQMEAELESDTDVYACELDTALAVPETATVNQSTAAILDGLGPPSLVSYYGSTVLGNYLSQPAVAIVRLADAQHLGVTGSGIVAIIDTGIDPNHPALQSSLLPGYDFVNGLAGTASELIDISPAAAAVLNQSTAAILDGTQMVLVNQSTAAILDQSTAAILDATQFPPAFGHGTMVAGIVHLTAPTAHILPLKAFSGDGTGMLSTILQAIYYAVDHNANVINMSFSLPVASPELTRAINYAAQHEVVAVASVGNTGQPAVCYPAALSNVIGVGSTSNLDVRSTFSSYGSMVFVGAPGEGIVTTYPGNNYAAAWGTSFSAPFVSGTAALVRQVSPYEFNFPEAEEAVGHAKSVSDMGKGRLDIYSAVQHAY